eukprot:9460961-Lingulodinium_polyedra.AAC.1
MCIRDRVFFSEPAAPPKRRTPPQSPGPRYGGVKTPPSTKLQTPLGVSTERPRAAVLSPAATPTVGQASSPAATPI